MKSQIEGLKWVQRSCNLPPNMGHGPAQYKWNSEVRRRWLRRAVDVLVHKASEQSVGGLHRTPDVILPPPHTSWQKNPKTVGVGCGTTCLPPGWIQRRKGSRINYRSLQKLCVFTIMPSGNSDNCTINGGVTTEDLPCLLKPAMLCAGSWYMFALISSLTFHS